MLLESVLHLRFSWRLCSVFISPLSPTPNCVHTLDKIFEDFRRWFGAYWEHFSSESRKVIRYDVAFDTTISWNPYQGYLVIVARGCLWPYGKPLPISQHWLTARTHVYMSASSSLEGQVSALQNTNQFGLEDPLPFSAGILRLPFQPSSRTRSRVVTAAAFLQDEDWTWKYLSVCVDLLYNEETPSTSKNLKDIVIIIIEMFKEHLEGVFTMWLDNESIEEKWRAHVCARSL